jgi:hypothetical protein
MNEALETEAPQEAPKVEAKPKVEPKPPVPSRLARPQRFSELSMVNNSWRYVSEVGITREQIEGPEFWQHVGYQLRAGDKIGVLTDDMTLYFDCIVLGAGNLWANVQVLHIHTLGRVVSSEIVYESKWGGPHAMWTVRRGKTVVEDKIKNREDAEKRAYALNMANR